MTDVATAADAVEAGGGVEEVEGPPAPPAPPTPPDGERGAPPAVGWGEAAFLVIGTLALAVAYIGTRWGVFTPDTRPDLYQNPAGFLRSTLQAWVGGASGLGQGNFNAGAAPVAVVVWVIRQAGAPAWLAVRIWRLLVLLVGAWGIRRYLGALMGRRLSAQARVLATVFWVVNPYVIVAGSTTPILLPYSLLPWTMLAFLQATRRPHSWRWPALFALAFFAQTGLNAGVVPFFQLLALPAHLAHARWVEGRRWRDLVRVLVRCGLCAVVVSLYWLLPSMIASGTGAGIAGGTENPVDVGRTSSYAETARLLGNWPLYGRAGTRQFLGDYTAYLTNPFVVVASFLLPFFVGLAVWRARARERLLVVVLLATALPVMVGLFPPDDPYPAGSALGAVFRNVPASLAFRTTNKVGAVVVLAEVIALTFGWRAWQARARGRRRLVRWSAVGVVSLLLLGLSAPLWNGGLYPLGYTIPGYWYKATGALDARDAASRVLTVPGGTGGNYRWGMRSPDDLFPSLLDRPVAVRNTVVGRGDPAGNFLSGFDGQLGQGTLAPGTISTTARYLGAGDVLVRNDLLTEEIAGPPPSAVVAQSQADEGLTSTGTYGRRGYNTVPGTSGKANKTARKLDPADAALHPLRTYQVTDPVAPVRVAPAADQVLVAGDGEALDALSHAGLADGTQPIRYLGDMSQAEFSAALRQGGRVVLTDTNRRRAWDINRTGNATSPTLSAKADIDQGNGATTTLWPDRSGDQTVSELSGGVTVGASRPGFGLHPFGRPSNAFDGDPTTAWVTGGFETAVGESIWIRFPEPQRVRSIVITPYQSDPAVVEAIRVRVGDKQVIEAVPADGSPFQVDIEPATARQVKVTILQQSSGPNPVGIAEIAIDSTAVRDVTRAPLTLRRLAYRATAADRARLAKLPLDVLLTRARGSALDPTDDEEAQLDRRFELPDERTYRFSGELAVAGADKDVLAQARAGKRPCVPVGVLDGKLLRARVVSPRAELADGRMRVEGCDDLALDAGSHELLTIIGWRLDRARFSSEGTQPPVPAAEDTALTVLDRSATRVEMEVGPSGSGPRVLRLGEAYDPRWRLTVDGRDAGEPIVVDGYSVGWLIDGDAHQMVATFGPQRAVQVSFVASAIGIVGITALAILPAPAFVRRRRIDRYRARRAAAGAGGGVP
ncbi:MAG: alpha-(1-_3)-arabinofuranosyltransferase family protein [Acidimicrobiales bacterium]